MYARRIRGRNQRWGLVFQQWKHLIKPHCQDHACYRSLIHPYSVRTGSSDVGMIRRSVLDSSYSRGVAPAYINAGSYGRSAPCLSNHQLRLYSSKGEGRNASEDNYRPVNDGANFDKGKARREKFGNDVKPCDVHAQLGEQDQKEWLNNEKLSIESKKKESPFLTRREKFKNEFLRRVVPWQKIHVSWETFPYYIHENTKNILVECVASNLKHKELSASYGARLPSSSGRILLQSVPGTELYRERVVRALARELQVPLLVLDSSVLAPYDFGDDCSSESESDEDNLESVVDGTSESDIEDENDASNEEDWTSSHETRTDCSDEDEVQATAEAALKKLVPYNLEEFEKVIVLGKTVSNVPMAGKSSESGGGRVSGESESSSESSKTGADESANKSKQLLKKGDRVKYIGPNVQSEASKRIILGKIPTSDGPTNVYTSIRGRWVDYDVFKSSAFYEMMERPLCSGQRGEVYEVNGDRVAVILDISTDNRAKEEKDEKSTEESASPPVYWLNVKDVEHDHDTQAEDCYIAMEALCEVLNSKQPLIVYFQDSTQWLCRAVPKSKRKEFVSKVHEMFDKLSGPVVLICGQNRVETGSKEKEKFTMILPNFGRLAKLPLPLKRLTEGLKATKRSTDDEIYKLFTNVLCIHPPKEEDLLRIFNKQLDEDRRIVISRSNLNELHKVLEENELSCLDLLQTNTDGVILTKRKAEKVVGWAKNHYLSSCTLPSIKGERLCLPRERYACLSYEIEGGRNIISETCTKPEGMNCNLAKDEYESNFVSAVVAPGEIGVKFDDIGALEDVKKALNELVILPMRRPELFSHGNLLRPCKGILLFGPPGTGKTLLAKALATEAGANFISITGSALTSKWFGDAEKLTKALFSFASKLAPVIIFVDEVDSLLGARGGGFEHEATRRMRNEFMAAWDGLRSKDSQRILILGATNRPFDLDDAVIRRLPRRIYVDLPDAGNRMKILKIFLAQENIGCNFSFEELANATEGYSGSDLKNLCIAAAYRPVQELLEEENKGGKNDAAGVLRPLNLDDFIQSKAKVGPSVAYDAASMNELRKWNEQYGEGGSRRKSPFGF
ncbi:P-loop containing nucleoside triphosphate hydrolases superfamily protein isoform 1 [Gossypium australe]|uniref:P-loop containing nucleoside triphosphate hydrolases superfamily protein isoform 1 n=1 Tax=Gossypium australe TaxID=47621 RepID=A0A5B6V0E2_9ROSI|nr:P-loop containing nucleoside triphosphate hydrolases superfamily protein isoform 1 [Gossypium australe]